MDGDTGNGTDDCGDCAALELRYLVALRACYYLTLHIRHLRFRERVIEDVALKFAQIFVTVDDDSLDFNGFFDAYCAEVQVAIDPAMLRAHEHEIEYRRVWTNHAAVLSGLPQLVQPRFSHLRRPRSAKRAS
nr:hypothetical protein GCM10020063_069930 [Dactylosporangium thailandense]